MLGEVVVQVIINGEVRDIDEGMTVARLLEELELEPRLVAVEKNRQLVPRSQHEQCLLEPEDRIEIVTLTGGG